MKFGNLTGSQIRITLSDFSGNLRHFNGMVWMLDIHNQDLTLGKYLEKTYIPWPYKMKKIKLSVMAYDCMIVMKQFDNGKDIGKTYSLRWSGESNLPDNCRYPSDIVNEQEVLPFSYLNALRQRSIDRLDIPIGQGNQMMMFFSFQDSENIFIVDKNVRSLVNLPSVSIPLSSLNSLNFLVTITSSDHQFKHGISLKAESWNNITLNPATINIA
ncbi:MAG TPA: hypothetical protein VH796_06225 [Nitrososphaeraceae archaeon]